MLFRGNLLWLVGFYLPWYKVWWLTWPVQNSSFPPWWSPLLCWQCVCVNHCLAAWSQLVWIQFFVSFFFYYYFFLFHSGSQAQAMTLPPLHFTDKLVCFGYWADIHVCRIESCFWKQLNKWNKCDVGFNPGLLLSRHFAGRPLCLNDSHQKKKEKNAEILDTFQIICREIKQLAELPWQVLLKRALKMILAWAACSSCSC